MNNDKPLTLNLSLEELNNIINVLGKQPYEQVFELINKIQVQAQEQLQEGQNNHEEVKDLSENGQIGKSE